MAEFVFRDMVNKQGLGSEFHIASAATSREELGNPVHHGTRRKLQEHGISVAGKTARQLTKKDYREYDYLIAMDDWNVKNMRRIVGDDSEKKVFKLLQFVGEEREIADPWYTGDFEATYQDVLKGCTGLLNQLTSHPL